MSRSVVGYTNDTLSEKIVYTGIDSDTAITLVDNDSESPTFGSIKVDVRPEVLGDKVESGDSSINVDTDSSGTKKISVNISSDPNNMITLEEDGINVSSEDFATEEELQEIRDTFASQEWVEDYVDGKEFVTEDDLAPLEEEISAKQDKLIAGDNITIENNVISADASSIKYNYRDLTGKPRINGIELNGNQSSEDLDITLQNLGIDNYDFATKTELHNEVSDSSTAIHNWVESNYRTKSSQDIIDAGKQDVINDLESIRSGAAKGDTSVQPDDISDMATETWVDEQGFAKDSDLSTVAKTGEYSDLTGVPTKTSDFINDGEGDLDSSGLYIPFSTMSDIGRLDARIDELIIEGGEPNKINHIDVNGVEVLPGNPDKTVFLTVPTETSDLTNDSGFITKDVNDLTNYYSKSDIDTDFYTKDDVDLALSEKQDNLIAGTGIEITETSAGPVISNTQTSAEWGNIEGNLEDQLDLAEALNNKVDKETGYSLMSEAEHEKLDTIEDYAQVNVIDGVDLDDFTIDSSKELKLNNLSMNKVTGLPEALEEKVDKRNGYSLMSQEEHVKLENIESGAQVNVIEGVSVNGTALTPSNKVVDVTVPTKVSDLDNDLDFQTSSEVQEAITTNNEEYVDVELSKKQDELIAGDGIDITYTSEGPVISNTNLSAEWGNIAGDIQDQVDLQTEFNTKVDKVEGKGLSTEDYTTADMNKLSGIESGAQVNIIEDVKVNGTSLDIVNKAVDITMPTAVSDLTNDLNFQTDSDVSTSISTHNSSETAHQDIRGLISNEATNRENADINLQEQIDAISSASDVVDVLGTYDELMAYDTSHLKDNDIVKVLLDRTHNDAISYYRWVIEKDSSGQPVIGSDGNPVGDWSYIGSQGPFYTKAEADEEFVPQTRTINGHDLQADINLSYSDVGALPDSTTIGDGTISIKKNNSLVGSFTVNQTGNTDIDISVPTKVSDLDNDNGYLSYPDLVEGTSISITEDSSGQVIIDNTMAWGDIPGTLSDQTDLKNALDSKQDVINSSNKLSAEYISGLATVATTGSYTDLSDLPVEFTVSEIDTMWQGA